MGCCSICLDETEEISFRCSVTRCDYELCAPCIKFAFEDASGENVRHCPSCKTPIAVRMIESLCGKGAVREVERELRGKVEFEVRKESEALEVSKEAMNGMKERANKLFQELCEELNMRCPRCKVVFYDYDGCNALTCTCRAAFCAICLKDCGSDAHSHVRVHGDLYNKDLFLTAKKKREQETVALFLKGISSEAFEVKELVRMKSEKILLTDIPETKKIICSSFLRKARSNLEATLKKDRMSLLQNIDPGRGRFSPFQYEDISPRNAIPIDFRLSLLGIEGSICTISLQRQVSGQWKSIPLPGNDETSSSIEHANSDPEIDSLMNIKQSLQCGIIAFQGATCLFQSKTIKSTKRSLNEDQVSIMLQEISSSGDLVGRDVCLDQTDYRGRNILGLNQNHRLVLLKQHIDKADLDTLLFSPLRQFLGETPPTRLFNDIPLPPPATFHQLNDEQKRVAHPLTVRTSLEVAGPPGTGKTKTITELIRSILRCTSHDVIVLSERNGAIDAIAEKIAHDCIKVDGKKKTVKDIELWTKVLCFGSSGMGTSAKLFTLNEKMSYHPELVMLKNVLDQKKEDQTRLTKSILKALAETIASLDEVLPPGSDALNKSRLIENNPGPELTTPLVIIGAIKLAADALHGISEGTTGSKGFFLFKSAGPNEKDIEDVVLEHSAILSKLIPVRVPKDKEETPWLRIRPQVLQGAKVIKIALESLLKNKLFDVSNAEKVFDDIARAAKSLDAAKKRVQQELLTDARVLMSTIGSSHKLPTLVDKSDDDDELSINPLTSAMNRLTVSSVGSKPTIVIFDEAGCIPSYEFLGLSRLGRSIEGLVCVGDKHQLPPYDPGSSRLSPNKRIQSNRFGYQNRLQTRTIQTEESISSLLDVSAMTADNEGKVLLTTQYRVPRDIANVLNSHIYKGRYDTAPTCQAPLNGFRFVDVPRSRSYERNEKYVNKDEIRYCIELARQSSKEYDSIMVLTPYKKQQRQLQFEFKKQFIEKIPILTIDQCQGQEADVVIISLVQKPTRFLNKNRFNVALSRVRQRLYLLADEQEFRRASRDNNWECYRIAQDLLQMAGKETDHDAGW